MIRNIYVRLGIVAVVVIVALVALYPSMVPKDPATGEPILPGWWKSVKALPQKRINMGLDLRGGVYLVYTVQLDKVVELEGQRIIETLDNKERRQEGIYVEEANITGDDEVVITFRDSSSFQKGGRIAKEQFSQDWNMREHREKPHTLVLEMKPNSLKKYRENALRQVRRTVFSRVDKWGLAEASVQVKPPDQLIVELPGIEETGRVDKVIKARANLELRLVLAEGSSREDILQEKGGRISRYQEIVPFKDPESGVIQSYFLMKKRADITGDCIANARQGFGGQFGNEAVVYFTLKPGDQCAGKFARLTGANIGKRLAIILDNEVISAPVIRARIRDSGVIEGDFTVEKANDLAVVLKSGSLRVPMVKDRVERVGPSLGQDHIRRGELAIIIGGVLVIIFMAFYYRLAGLASDIALVLNLVLILAALATFGATLTLPGLAGIILTVGMAVDANVLIFERIREELRTGKTPKASVDLGYKRALITILDANITTFIAAAVLYFNGTGPIKGFAVTLMFGIVFSVFTAVFVTRIIMDFRLERSPESDLSI